MEQDLRTLLDRIRAGDETAFASLCEMYRGVRDHAVHRFAPSFGIGDGLSPELYGLEDLSQYASLALYKAAVTYEPDDKGKHVSFGLYAKICINNALISQLRKYKSELRRRQAVKREERLSQRSSDPLLEFTAREEAGALLEKIAAVLSPYEKEIFDRYIEGKSVGEIAERLGKEEKSVSNALYRMKVKVRGLLKI